MACFMVICSHIRDLPWKPTGELRESAVFFDTLFSVCVTIFFMITGFYIYNKKGNIIKDWLNLIKKFFKDLFIPLIVTWLICNIFEKYIINQKTFIECIKECDLKAAWDNIYHVITTFRTSDMVGTAGHLWFFFSYFVIIIEYPIIRLLLTKANRYVIFICFAIFSAMMIYNDYMAYFSNGFSTSNFFIFQKPVFHSAVGHVLNNYFIKKYIDEKSETSKSIIINKPVFFISLIIYTITFVLLYKTQKGLYLGRNNGYPYTTWASYFSLFLTTSFMLLVYNINIEKFLNEKIANIIYFISDKTFGIYLVHYPIVTRLNYIEFQSNYANRRSIFIHHFIYFALYGTFIFIISLLLVTVIKTIVKAIKSMIFGRIVWQKEKIT